MAIRLLEVNLPSEPPQARENPTGSKLHSALFEFPSSRTDGCPLKARTPLHCLSCQKRRFDFIGFAVSRWEKLCRAPIQESVARAHLQELRAVSDSHGEQLILGMT